MASPIYRKYVETFESELLRGIDTLSILNIIKEHQDEGIYGYELLKELAAKTNKTLIIDEGTLYPILKKLENWGDISLIVATRKKVDGRMRNYYTLTKEGLRTYYHLEGFFAKLIESVSPLFDFEVKLKKEKYLFCPMCANKIDISLPENKAINFCEICGSNLRGLIPLGSRTEENKNE